MLKEEKWPGCKKKSRFTLPETNSSSAENGWLEYFLVSFGGVLPIFRGELLVSGRVHSLKPTVRPPESMPSQKETN